MITAMPLALVRCVSGWVLRVVIGPSLSFVTFVNNYDSAVSRATSGRAVRRPCQTPSGNRERIRP